MLRTAITALAILPMLAGSSAASGLGPPGAGGTGVEVVATGDKPSGESGIVGQISIRPVRPHATVGMPNIAPYQAKLEVLDLSGRVVTSFESDAGGNFRLALPPGKYVLRPQSSGLYPRASEQRVVVSPKKFTQVQVIYDSGIR